MTTALRETDLERHVLMCPECEEEFVLHGDVAMKYIVAEWERTTGEKGYRSGATPKDVWALFNHEHDPSNFLDKKAGLPFMSREVSGMKTAPASHWQRS